MLERAHIAYTMTVESSSSDNADELHCFDLYSYLRFGNLSEDKEPITGDMQHAVVVDSDLYRKRLESIHAVESAVVVSVDKPASARG